MNNIELKNSPYVRLIHSVTKDGYNLVEGVENDKGKIKHSTAFLLPKNKEAYASIPGLTDTQLAQLLKGAEDYKNKVEAAANKEKPKGAKLDNLFKCGDEKADAAIETYKEENPKKPVPDYLENTRNFWICNASTLFEPKFHGPKGGEAMDIEWAKENIKDGYWVRAETRGYSWSYNGRKGWSLGLAGKVQLWQMAEEFGGSAGGGEAEESMEVVVPKETADDFID